MVVAERNPSLVEDISRLPWTRDPSQDTRDADVALLFVRVGVVRSVSKDPVRHRPVSQSDAGVLRSPGQEARAQTNEGCRGDR